MKPYLFDSFNRFKRFSEKLDIETILCNKTWRVFNDSGEKEIYIFLENKSLIISNNGIVTNAEWDFVPTNKSIIIKSVHQSVMIIPTFLDKVIFTLQLDGTSKYVFLIDESKREQFSPKTLSDINLYFVEKARKIELIEQKQKDIELERKRQEILRKELERKELERINIEKKQNEERRKIEEARQKQLSILKKENEKKARQKREENERKFNLLMEEKLSVDGEYRKWRYKYYQKEKINTTFKNLFAISIFVLALLLSIWGAFDFPDPQMYKILFVWLPVAFCSFSFFGYVVQYSSLRKIESICLKINTRIRKEIEASNYVA